MGAYKKKKSQEMLVRRSGCGVFCGKKEEFNLKITKRSREKNDDERLEEQEVE